MIDKLEQNLQIKSLEDNLLEIVSNKQCSFIEALTIHIEERFDGMKLSKIPDEDLADIVSSLSEPMRDRLAVEFTELNMIKSTTAKLDL